MVEFVKKITIDEDVRVTLETNILKHFEPLNMKEL